MGAGRSLGTLGGPKGWDTNVTPCGGLLPTVTCLPAETLGPSVTSVAAETVPSAASVLAPVSSLASPHLHVGVCFWGPRAGHWFPPGLSWGGG